MSFTEKKIKTEKKKEKMKRKFFLFTVIKVRKPPEEVTGQKGENMEDVSVEKNGSQHV